jgi:hypothetical protein
MRKILGLGLLAAAGLVYGLGAGVAGETREVFLVYSADERSELFPCG